MSLLKPNSALYQKLSSALDSRDNRWIRRRLPDPSTSSSSSSPYTLTDFTSNDYLSLSSSPHLRSHFLQKLSCAPLILGSGGSRLLVNGQAHSDFEQRLKQFFNVEAALLFNSGFDANVGFFSCVMQEGDVIVFDEFIHASVHDGIKGSRVGKEDWVQFGHNCLKEFRSALVIARNKVLVRCEESRSMLRSNEGRGRGRGGSVFVAVESLYSMDGTFAPLKEMVEIIEEVFGKDGSGNGNEDVNINAYLVVDEAHSTGIYGNEGRGRVEMLGLEDKVLARLHTFGKALAASGAVVLTNNIIKDYMLNYARSLIYTTSLSYANIIAADASFDMLIDGTAKHLSKRLLELSVYLTTKLSKALKENDIPSSLISLHPSSFPTSSPSYSSSHSSKSTLQSSTNQDSSPIIPILTPHPRPLSTYLLTTKSINARPITWPTVPKGKDRVRVCLHSGNSFEEVDLLVEGVIKWGLDVIGQQKKEREMIGREFVGEELGLERSKL